MASIRGLEGVPEFTGVGCYRAQEFTRVGCYRAHPRQSERQPKRIRVWDFLLSPVDSRFPISGGWGRGRNLGFPPESSP